jgi:hypothetical protein
MAPMTRRFFLLSSAAIPAACAMNRGNVPPAPTAAIRAPKVGQSWRYAKHDLISRALLDVEVDRIAAVGKTVDIESQTEGSDAKPASPSAFWGTNWLRRYFDRAKPSMVLPSEVQAPWGMVLVDPHWNHVQVYEAPIPLWPTQLVPGWHSHIRSKFKTAESDNEMGWDQTMKAEGWETVTVPAGQFTALRYLNAISFKDPDPARTNSKRHETIWFAPEVGRWVARESAGQYYLDNSVDDSPHNENGYRWELLEWK